MRLFADEGETELPGRSLSLRSILKVVDDGGVGD